jgi:hypothetical protein
MPKLAKPLTDIQPKNAKRKEKPYKLADGGGMYLLINPDGSKYWRLGYRFSESQKVLAFGKYPEVSLKQARELREAARALLAKGIDPAQAKRVEKATASIAAANTFEAVTREGHANKLESWQAPPLC